MPKKTFNIFGSISANCNYKASGGLNWTDALKVLHIFIYSTEKESIIKLIYMEHVLLEDGLNGESMWVAILNPKWHWLMTLEAPPTAIHQHTDQEPVYIHAKKSSKNKANITLWDQNWTRWLQWWSSYPSLHHQTFWLLHSGEAWILCSSGKKIEPGVNRTYLGPGTYYRISTMIVELYTFNVNKNILYLIKLLTSFMILNLLP